MSEADEATRLQLVKMEAGTLTPLEMAMSRTLYTSADILKVLANPKWGEGVIQAMDSMLPIPYYAKHGYYNADSLSYLCQVFSRGLAAAYFCHQEWPRYIIAKHPKFAQSIDEILPKTGDTALYKATIKGNTKHALEALSLGANPNIQCRRNPKWRDYPEELRTPMVMAVASGQRQVARVMDW
ncbi:hypothetical protein Pelo_19682 [Pelomyxa schiedti]|nr:hypothetical protein Pelo_19682 [Pelomyxa schiedti]